MVKPGFEQASSTSLDHALSTQAHIANLGYGAQQIPFRFDPQQFSLLARHETTPAPLTDTDLHTALDAPINSPRLEEFINLLNVWSSLCRMRRATSI